MVSHEDKKQKQATDGRQAEILKRKIQLPEKQQQRDGKKHQAKSLQQQECSINDQVIA